MFSRFLEEKEGKLRQKKEPKQLNSSFGSLILDELIPKASAAVASNNNQRKIDAALREGNTFPCFFLD